MALEPGQLSATLVNASQAQTSIAIWVDMQSTVQSAPIAWLCASLPPKGFVEFAWTRAYSYIWADTGPLSGAIVSAEQHFPAQPGGRSGVRLEPMNNSYQLVPYTFSKPPPPDTLWIGAVPGIPLNQLAIGVNLQIDQGSGQPGNGCSVVQAQPNTDCTWTVGETYFCNFGDLIKQSEYDPSFATQTPLQLDFGLQSAIGILLDSDNTLTQMNNQDLQRLISSGAYTRVTTSRRSSDERVLASCPAAGRDR